MNYTEQLTSGQTFLGIELGSTRIKAVLTAGDGSVIATGIHDWENSLINNIWTYSKKDILDGLRNCYTSLRVSVEEKYGVTLTSFKAMGISAMMHGYIALDKDLNFLAPFQTWRNTNTQDAADELTNLFDFNIPLRWSVSHLYQRILDKERHLSNVDYVTTLSGYIHLLLTGRKVLGIGDASGMFPIDSTKLDYDDKMVKAFDNLTSSKGFSKPLRTIFPEVLSAGEGAGILTEEGAALLDTTGNLEAGIPLCPPEGDAGTGMVATNSVAPGTGNVSAGTSTFAMIILKKQLSKLYREIDMVTTPDGYPCAMSHANNGTTDLNAWVNLFGEFAALMGINVNTGNLFEKLYTHSLEGDDDCGGLLPYGYYSGENITMINEGRPVFLRTPDSKFTLANLMRSHLFTSLGAVKLGMDILTEKENVNIEKITGHGGFFKTKGVGQLYLSAAVNAPVTVMDTASEGGAWGISILAAYMSEKGENESLSSYLDNKVFTNMSGSTLMADKDTVNGFNKFMEHYVSGLSVEKSAIDAMKW